MSRRFRAFALFCLLVSIPSAVTLVALFSNGGFEDGTFNGWTKSTFLNNGLTGSQPFIGSSITRGVGGLDWSTIEGGPGVTPLSLSDAVVGPGVQFPRFGEYAARVNYAGANYPNRNSNALVQQAVVSSSDVDPYDNQVHLRFAYLPVVQDGGHAPAGQAYFYVVVKNVTQGDQVLWERFTYAAEAGVPWQTANGYQFTDWQVMDVAPGNSAVAVGDTISIEVVAAGCSAGGHGAWVYLDAFGSQIPGANIVGSAAAAVRPGSPLQYHFHVVNGGTGALGASVAQIVVPAQTVFASVSDNRCSHAAGIVTCSLGTLAPGETVDFDMTVTVNGGASGTIALGTYSVSGTNYPALLGPVVNTTVDPNANRPPVATADTYTVDEDAVLSTTSGGVLTNDVDADGETLTASLVVGPSHGALTLNPDGTFVYTPVPNYSGADSFSYRAHDATSQTPVTTVTLTVTSIPDAPVAWGDAYSTPEDGTLTVTASGILANDSDADGNPLSAVLVSGPAHGALQLNPDGSFSYVPFANYAGADTFAYRAADGGLQSGITVVALTVTAVADAPVATPDAHTLDEDTTLAVAAPGVLANDSDADGDTLAAALVSGPAHGALQLNANGSFTYVPAGDYFGADSFTYRVTDGTTFSAPVIVSLAVASVEDIAWYPHSGRASGGVRMTIHGAGFGPAGGTAIVTLGGVPALDVQVLNSGTITLVTPALPAGTSVSLTISIPGLMQQTFAGAYLPIADPPAESPTDTDGDGLSDEWEARYGLDPSDPSDANVDSDGDGRTNTAEHSSGSHPTASYRRFFAEGLNHPQVDTRIALANASAATARVRLTFFRQDAASVSQELEVPGLSRRSLDTRAVAGLADAAFGIAVESNEAVVAERTMTWNWGGEGATLERAVAASTTWQFAEGATTGGFSLFYLLTNPDADPADVVITFLPQQGAPIQQSYRVPGFARVSIPVNTAHPALASADLGATVTSSRPIVAERSMYLSAPGLTWLAGTSGTGLPEALTRWTFAEGAVGPFFDTWFLLANPGTSDATVDVRYLDAHGTQVVTSHTVPAGRRTTIRVADDAPGLFDASFATVVTSTNGVPIVAERAMWWENDGSGWTEGHVGGGHALAGTLWVTADGVAATDGSSDTFLLIANTSAAAATVKLTLVFEDGGTPSVERTMPVEALRRATVRVRYAFPEAVGKSFAVLVESTGSSPSEIVVDHSMYWNTGGVLWGSGTSAPATRIR